MTVLQLGTQVNECNGVDLDTRKKFSTLRVVRPWHRLPREAVDAPTLDISKARLDGAFRNLGWWKGSLTMARGWNWMICKVPSSPNRHDSMTFSILLEKK